MPGLVKIRVSNSTQATSKIDVCSTDEVNHKEHEGHKDDGHERLTFVVFVPFVVLFIRVSSVLQTL